MSRRAGVPVRGPLHGEVLEVIDGLAGAGRCDPAGGQQATQRLGLSVFTRVYASSVRSATQT